MSRLMQCGPQLGVLFVYSGSCTQETAEEAAVTGPCAAQNVPDFVGFLDCCSFVNPF